MAQTIARPDVELKGWKGRLSVSHRKHKALEDDLDTYLRYYRGEQWLDTAIQTRFNDRVTDNIIFPNIRAMIPRLNSRNPKIFVTPINKPHQLPGGQLWDSISSSMFMEILLNYYYRTLNIKRENRRILYDAFLGHMGIMELGYTVETEKIKQKGKKSELLEVDELIKSESVFVRRRSMKDFRRDPEACDHLLYDDRWVALAWVKELEDIKADPSFENTKNLKTNFTVRTDFGATQTDDELSLGERDLWGRVRGWTIWDKKLRRRYRIVEEHQKFLSNEKYPKWMQNVEGFPVEAMYINENPDEAFPVSDISIYKRTQDEINMIGSMQLSHIRGISERKYVTTENALEQAEERKLSTGGDGTVIKVKGGNVENKLVPLRDAPISQDIYMIQRLKKQEASEMSGVSPMERNQATKFDTATEPALISQNSETIRGDQRNLFEDFQARVAKKMSFLLQATLSKSDIPLNDTQFQDIDNFLTDAQPGLKPAQQNVISKLDKIVTQEGSTMLNGWLTLSKEDIVGDYEFDIEIGSTAPINSETRKRDALQLAQLMDGNPDINSREGTKAVLEAFDRKDIDKLMLTEEVVQQNQQAQVEQVQEAQAQEQNAELQKKEMDMQKAVTTTAQKVEGNLLVEAMRQSGEKEKSGSKEKKD